MIDYVPRSRFGGAATLLALVAVAAMALPAAAAPDSGTITVTGASAEKIILTLNASSLDFGSNLTPDGDASDSADTINVQTDAALGACYYWAGSATVSSNASYDLTVSSSNDVPELGFLLAAPGAYASCVGGEAASASMDFGGSPASAWVDGASRTASRLSAFWLGLDVLWDADANANLADTVLTITAQANT